MEKLRSLNRPVAKVLAVHSGSREAKNADSDTAKGLKAQLLLARGARILLIANLWTAAGFNNYEEPTITALDGTEAVPIVSIRRKMVNTSWQYIASENRLRSSLLQFSRLPLNCFELVYFPKLLVSCETIIGQCISFNASIHEKIEHGWKLTKVPKQNNRKVIVAITYWYR
ncbi:unnamed protein product [Rhizophagus irregularis]|nr:unnamed protein product [Rhizophagus irregularis]